MKWLSLLLAIVAVVPISATVWDDMTDTIKKIEIPSAVQDWSNRASKELSKIPENASNKLSEIAELASHEVSKVPKLLLKELSKLPPIDLPHLPLDEAHKIADKYCSPRGMSVQCNLPLIIKEELIAHFHLNITIPENDLAYYMVLKVNDMVVFEDHLSVKNPPPVCLSKTRLAKVVDLCVGVHDLTIENRTFSGCLAFHAAMGFGYLTSRSLEVGCLEFELRDGKPKYNKPNKILSH